MRVFYGVQGTGNGHITRARIMANEFYKAGISVDFQFSGRALDQYFNMAIFGDYRLKHGLSFAANNGKVSYIKTALETRPLNFIHEVKSLDLSGYDMVISDFEPVTAWAAKMQGIPIFGIGHQYAFKYDIPKQGSDPLANTVMRYFAPADKWAGLHWYHFNQPILPPIIKTNPLQPTIAKKIVVYLPFDNTEQIIECLKPIGDYKFHIYTPKSAISNDSHIICKPLCYDGFQQDIASCEGIISGAGFELVSEALQLGKKILVKPIKAQMEQISNAAALRQLGYGHTMMELETDAISRWLQNGHAVKVDYPNTAAILVDWLKTGMPAMNSDCIENIWRTVTVTHFDT
jgi:uncharacterized protein (TIGR00661 family)